MIGQFERTEKYDNLIAFLGMIILFIYITIFDIFHNDLELFKSACLSSYNTVCNETVYPGYLKYFC